MKSLIIALLIAVAFTPSVDAQDKPDKEMTYALVGPVRTVRTENANMLEKNGQYIEGTRVLSMTISFNEDGNRTELGLYDDKGSLSRRIVSKFDGKKMVEFLNYDSKGNMWLRGVEKYDAEGRSLEKATYNGDGSLRSKTIFTRNARGQLIEWAEYDAKETLLEKNINQFNEEGEVTTLERSFYGPDGSLKTRYAHTNNRKEKRVETDTFDGDGTLASKIVSANRKEITEYAADGSLRTSTILSNTGRLPDKVRYNPDGTTSKESQMLDEVDSHGNWIKSTKWVSDSQGTRPVTVSYRIITYY